MATKCSMDSAGVSTDLFREEFKYFKKKKPPPDLSKAIDLRNAVDPKVKPVPLQPPPGPPVAGLRPVALWKAFTHQDTPGFVVIVNPFEAWFQRYWMRRCLVDYPCLPNRCNLDAHMERKASDNLWQQALLQRGDNIGFEKTTFYKLRWTTLGYHHNWDTKQYSTECMAPFPGDLADLSSYVASTLGYPAFKAEAAIINYYHLDSTLAGHTDHSELDMTAPLFSFSFGQSCIFLLGGPSKETRPVAFYLHSGDIAVMSGAARLAYHAVPRVLTHQPAPGVTASPWTLDPHCTCYTSEQTDSMCGQCQTPHFLRPTDEDSYTHDSNIHDSNTHVSNTHDSNTCHRTTPEDSSHQDSKSTKPDCSSISIRCGQHGTDTALISDQVSSLSGNEHDGHDGCTKKMKLCRNGPCDTPTEKTDHAIYSDGLSRSRLGACECSKEGENVNRHFPSGCATGTNVTSCAGTTNMCWSLPHRNVAGCSANILQDNASVHWTPFEAYLSTSRINMNVRQVLGKNQELPS